MNNNDVEIIATDITDIAPQANDTGLLDTSADNIIYLADRAEKYIEALNRIIEAALKITNELDWVIIGGRPYLQESGSTKIACLFGISIQLAPGTPFIEIDANGYKTYTYKARFMFKNQFVECEGSRSMKEDFFAKTKTGIKKPDEIEERDVKMAAYTNCLNNGIKRLIPGLRNIDVATLERAGIDVYKCNGYTFKDGTKGGTTKAAEESGLKCKKCGAAVTQKVASFSQSKFNEILCMNCQKEAAPGK